MSENVFASRLRLSGGAPSDITLPDVLTEPETDEFGLDDEETAKLLVIPISQEIAADFQLIGYDSKIRRIEEVLTQRGKQRNVMLYGPNGSGKTAVVQGLVQAHVLSAEQFAAVAYGRCRGNQ